MTKHNPTQNIRRSLKLSVLALVAGSALWHAGCDAGRFNKGEQVQLKGSREIGIITRERNFFGEVKVRYWTDRGYSWWIFDEDDLEPALPNDKGQT